VNTDPNILEVNTSELGVTDEPERSWIVPCVLFWATMVTVVVVGYCFTPERCKKSFDVGPTLGVGWGVAGVLAAILTGFVSEFIVESQLSSRLLPKTKTRLAIVVASLICIGTICLGIRIAIFSFNTPHVL